MKIFLLNNKLITTLIYFLILGYLFLNDDYNATLPIASLGLEYSISGGHSIASTVQHQALSYQSMSETNIYVQYAIAL